MKLQDLPDDFTFDQFRRLDKAGLDAVPYTLLHWACQCKGCKNGTTVRDYGLTGWFFLHRNSKAAERDPSSYWMGWNNYWLCGKHNKLFKRLVKSYDIDHIFRRIMDPEKIVIAGKRSELSSMTRGLGTLISSSECKPGKPGIDAL